MLKASVFFAITGISDSQKQKFGPNNAWTFETFQKQNKIKKNN